MRATEHILLESDVRTGTNICPDVVAVRVENHAKNPNAPSSGFRDDIVIERYEVRYFRSDGRGTEGVDVPFRISGNLAFEIIGEAAENVPIEVVRRQAKLEPPLSQLVDGGGGFIVTFNPPDTLKVLEAVQQQGLQDRVKWGCSTPCNTDFLANALGSAWNEKLFVNAELKDYKLCRLGDVGEIVVDLFEPESERKRGVIGLGEPPVISPGAAPARLLAMSFSAGESAP